MPLCHLKFYLKFARLFNRKILLTNITRYHKNHSGLKRNLIIILSLIAFTFTIANSASAQKRKVLNLQHYDEEPYHFGFILGLNQMLFTVKPVDNLPFIKWEPKQSPDISADSLFVYSVTSTPTPGFTIGILGNLRLGKYFDMRFIPALSFGERRLNYSILSYTNDTATLLSVEKSISSTYVDFPLEFRYKSKRLNNMLGYVLGGVNYSIDLASQKKAEEASNTTTVKLFKNDVSLLIGAGVDFYTSYFKFGIQARMSYGMNNLIQYEDNLYTNSIGSLKSKVFMLSFTFE
jgi:hypothetical protein